MRRVVITGGTGFIGRAVAQRLADAGVAHAAWGRGRCDVRDAESLRRALHEARPTHVLHLAAAGIDPHTARDPGVAVDNVRMAAALLEVLRGTDVTLLAAGSMAELGPTTGERVDERAPCAPTSAYAIGKLAATQLLLHGAEGVRARVARLFGVYGPGEAPTRLFPSVVRALDRGEELALSDGEQVRDFVHVEDAAHALVTLLFAEDVAPLVNVGTGHGISVREAVLRVARAAGGDLGLLRFGARPRNPTDADRLVADTTLLERVLGAPLPTRLQGADLDALVASLRGLP
ncbi:MAG: NAD-dependent epimerase/dehydratase family protein [Sandaracinaceae bacterium]